MADIQPPLPVKLFIAILHNEISVLGDAVARLVSRFGEVDFRGEAYPFDMTDYYENEMGKELVRTIVAFEELVPPDALPDIKLVCNVIEEEMSIDGKRRVNLDSGYIDHHKVVLASAKGAGHKIYIAQGIWADFAARYKKGAFVPMEWSFPDFRDQRYNKELLEIRRKYLAQRK